MIKVEHVNKSFGNQQVLFDVSAAFYPGKVNLIIGQSGQGKSVLAKCMVGLHEVDSGNILFNNRDFTAMEKVRKAKSAKKLVCYFRAVHFSIP